MIKVAWEDNNNLVPNFTRVRNHVGDWNMHIVKSIQKEKTNLMRILGGIQRSIQEGRWHSS